MSKYSITDLEKITGIKAHTLRVWEKRYGIVKPQRGPNNVRCYCDKDLEKLVRICELNKAGYKISRLASLTFRDLEILYHNKRNFKCHCEGLIDGLTLAVEGLEENRLFIVLYERLQQLGIKTFILEVVKPLQERLGLLIMSGHFSKLHLDFAEDVIESILITENAKLKLGSNHCVASVLLVHLGPTKPRIPSLILKHMLLQRNVEITMFVLEAGELESVLEIINMKKFHEVYYCCNNNDQNNQFDFKILDQNINLDIDYIICGPGREHVYNVPDAEAFKVKDPMELYEHLEYKYAYPGQEVDYSQLNN